MQNLKELYRQNVYGVMGTLIFHILIFGGLWISELNFKIKTEKEEIVLLDMIIPPSENKVVSDQNRQSDETTGQNQTGSQNMGSNLGVNDAYKKNKYQDPSLQREIEDAEKMVDKVNKQLSKKIPQTQQYAMPEAVTEGQNPDSIKNTIYTGKSNIHYFLENRFHVRLPIPVFLAKSGGLIAIDIQVDRSGKVVKADARSSSGSSDPMLPVYATQAAERTVFNADPKAPTIQRGTITYRFVAQ